MSERPIEVGDLVQVVRTCCHQHGRFGKIFTVASILKSVTSECNRGHTTFGDVCRWDDRDETVYLPMQWLKRIPPLSELESTDETIKETV